MKGITFSMDSLFALLIIAAFVPVLLIVSFQKPEEKIISLLQTEAEDSINVVSNLRIKDVRNEPVIDDLFDEGVFTDSDLNTTLLEMIGALWASDNVTLIADANNISKNIVSKIIPSTVKWRLTIDNETIYNSSQNITRTLTLSKRVLSGVAKGKPSKGFLSNAFIVGIEKRSASYVFFGGFVGQGNITAIIRDIPLNSSITSIYLELNSPSNSTLYANGVLCQQINASSGFNVSNWTITSLPCLNAIVGGAENNLSIDFTGNLSTSYIGGGFLKISYDTEEFVSASANRYYFPGINGLVNVYDSFYVNGNISSMNLTLNYKTGVNYSVIMELANATIVNKTSNGTVENVFVSSSNIETKLSSSGISYSYLSGKTIPIRLLVSANITSGLLEGDTDIVLITDRSGSMDWRLNQDGVSGIDVTDCNNSTIFSNTTKRISLARCLAKDFVNAVLGGNASKCTAGTVKGNRISLVSFGGSASPTNSVNLSENLTLLVNTINSYTANLGATCVSCSINRAWEILNSQSNSTRLKYVIVMTDGETNQRSTPTCSDTYGIDAKNLSSAFVSGNLGRRMAKLNGNVWEEVNITTSNTIRSVSIFNDTFGFAVGDSGTILRWNGTEWSTFSSPTGNNLRKIDMLNETLGFAVGSGDTIIRWNGTTWSTQTSPTSGQTINSVDMLNQTLAFAVSTSGKILRWNSTSWAEINDFGIFAFNDIVFVSSTLAFAVGDGGVIYEWNGVSWALDQDMGINDIDGVDAIQDRAFAVGASGKIYTWTGTTWSQTVDTGSENHNEVSIVNSTLAYAVSSNGDSGNALLYAWNGNAWNLFKPNIKYAYGGNSTAGASCGDSDSDSLSLNQSYPALNANWSAGRIMNTFFNVSNTSKITIDSIGFGPISAPTRILARETLQSIATTGNGTYYASSDGQTLQTIYCQIADNINTRLTLTQILLISGNLTPATLYPNSFIEYQYNSSVATANYQEISVNLETDKFPSCNGSLFVPAPLRVVDAKATSYSSDLWTSLATLRNTQNYVVFNISEYRKNFTELGDPFIVRIPENQIQINTTNYVNVSLGLSPNNITSSCSSWNRVIYTVRMRASAPYGDVLEKSSGGNYRIYFDKNFDGTQDGSFTITLGEDLPGFDPTIKDIPDLDSQNAIEDALQRLLTVLNFVTYPSNSGPAGSSTNPIDLELRDVTIDTASISGIPFTWGPADFRVEVGI